ncbi:MAG: discoidin domain-containing protein, partial [Oscillospiraceae bacterium]
NYTEKFAKTAYAITHEEYPTDQCYAACDSFKICSDIYDVNYGNKNNCVPKDKAIFIREYGDNYREQFGRQDTTKRVCRGWDKFYSYGEFNMLQSAIQRMVQFDRLYMHPQISGGAIWAGIDHNRGYIDNAAMVGVLDLYRLPKTSYYAYKSQRPIEEVTVLYGTYDWEVKPEELFVFSNCDEIKVTINGEETTTLKPNNAYLKQEKLLKLASNVPTSNEVLNEIQVNVVKEGLSGMPHPPFILNLPKEDIKIIEIDGIYKGNVVANQKLSKPSMAKSIVLSAEDYNMEFLADGADVIMIYAYAKDVDGNTCNTFEESVTFSIEGNGRLIGQNPINFAAGIIGILVKSTTNPGEIKVLAKCMDIVSDVLIITSIKDKTLHLPIPTQKVTKTEFVYEADKCMNDLDPNVQMFNIESEGNLAINASIVASSELSEYKACNMNDGNHGTKWVATDDTLQEILIILDKVYDIGNIKVWWDSDNTEYYYRIAVSSDGVEYETVLDKVGTGQDIKADEIHKPNIKFIKVYVDKVSKDVAGIYNIMIFEDNKA